MCEANHYSTADGCEPCAKGGYVYTVVVSVVALAAVAFIMYRSCAGGGRPGGKVHAHAASPTLQAVPSELVADRSRKLAKKASGAQKKFASYAGMATAFWQMVTNIAPIYNIQWPGSFAIFMRELGGIISLDAFKLLPIDCIGRTNHHSGLLLYVVGTAGVITIGLGYIAHLHFNVSGHRAEAKKELATRGLLVFLNFIYMPVSTKAFQTYPCEEFEDGTEMLKVDYSIDCKSDEHVGYVALAGVTTAVFVIGMPIVSLSCCGAGSSRSTTASRRARSSQRSTRSRTPSARRRTGRSRSSTCRR